MLDYSLDILSLLDGEGRLLYNSPAALRLHGFTPAEMDGRSTFEFIHPDDGARVAEAFQRCLAHPDEPAQVEYRYARKQGTWIWMEAVAINLLHNPSVRAIVVNSRDISARVAAQEAALEYEQFSESAFNALSSSLVILDRNGRIQKVNQAWKDFAAANGYREPRPWEGINYLEICDTAVGQDSEGAKAMAEGIRALLRGERAEFILEYPCHSPSQVRWFQARVTRFPGASPTPLVISHFDITSLKQAEADLREISTRWQLATAAGELGVWEWDLAADRLLWDVRMHAIFGVEPSPGLDCFSLWDSVIHPEDRSQAYALLEEALKGKDRYQAEFRIRRADGEIRNLQADAVVLRDASGKAIRMVGLNRDITAERASELALQESEGRYRALFTHMVQGFAFCRMEFKDGQPDDFTYLEVNPAFTAHSGLADVVGRRVSEVIPGIRAADPGLFERYGRVVETGTPENFEIFVSALDRWFSISAYRPMAAHFVAVFQDITERKRVEEERLQLERQLHRSQKLESLGSLAGGVAHDMNNVLGSILGLASLHQETEAPGTPRQQAFATIAKACDRGGDLVRRLLDFARQELTETKELDLNALLQEETQLLERTFLAQVRFVLDLARDLRPVRGDAAALTHAVMNLCVNAVDAMPGGGTLTLRTRNGAPGWVEVEVEDSGVGMSREVLDKALDPFFTTKPQGKGTGLGLGIVYATVKAHQGALEIFSEPLKGTRVVMRFPACERGAVPAAEPGVEIQSGQTRALDVLLVDDDELIRTSMEAMLQVLGHRVVVTDSAEAALTWLASGRRPQVIILDMNMPGLGGAGALPHLRAQHPEVPIFLATGRADQTAHALAQAFPGVTLLAKPFGMAELQRRLSALG